MINEIMHVCPTRSGHSCSKNSLHYYLNLMHEALDAGRFGAFRAQLKAERARGI